MVRFRVRLDVEEMGFPSIYQTYTVPGGSDLPRKYGCSFPYRLLSDEQRTGLEPREQKGGGPDLVHCSTKWRPRVGLFNPNTDQVIEDRQRLLMLHTELMLRDAENRSRDSLFREFPTLVEMERMHYETPMRSGTMLLLHRVWVALS